MTISKVVFFLFFALFVFFLLNKLKKKTLSFINIMKHFLQYLLSMYDESFKHYIHLCLYTSVKIYSTFDI